MSGVELIAEERSRQIGVEGYTTGHDDLHRKAEIARAGVCYAETAVVQMQNGLDGQPLPPCYWHKEWPFDRDEFKASPDAIRNLVKAGALIAAEIDRLQRKNDGGSAAVPAVPPTPPPRVLKGPCVGNDTRPVAMVAFNG